MHEAFGKASEQAIAARHIGNRMRIRKVFRSFFRLLMLFVCCGVGGRDSITRYILTTSGRNDNPLNVTRALVNDFRIFYRIILCRKSATYISRKHRSRLLQFPASGAQRNAYLSRLRRFDTRTESRARTGKL